MRRSAAPFARRWAGAGRGSSMDGPKTARDMGLCVCVCVCVCARARVRACGLVGVCMYVSEWVSERESKEIQIRFLVAPLALTFKACFMSCAAL